MTDTEPLNPDFPNRSKSSTLFPPIKVSVCLDCGKHCSNANAQGPDTWTHTGADGFSSTHNAKPDPKKIHEI